MSFCLAWNWRLKIGALLPSKGVTYLQGITRLVQLNNCESSLPATDLKLETLNTCISLLKFTRLRELVILAERDVFAPADDAFAVLG